MFNEHSVSYGLAADLYTYSSVVTHEGHQNVSNGIVIT